MIVMATPTTSTSREKLPRKRKFDCKSALQQILDSDCENIDDSDYHDSDLETESELHSPDTEGDSDTGKPCTCLP